MSSRSVFGRFLLRDNAFAFVSASMRMVRPVSKSACAHVGSEFCFGINKQTRRKFHAILSTCQVIEAHHRAGCRSFGGLLGLQEINRHPYTPPVAPMRYSKPYARWRTIAPDISRRRDNRHNHMRNRVPNSYNAAPLVRVRRREPRGKNPRLR